MSLKLNRELPLLFLVLGLISGQMIKFPPGTGGGAIALDGAIFILTLLALFQLKFNLKKPPFWIKTGLSFVAVVLISLILTPLKLKFDEYLHSLGYALRFATYLLLGWAIYSQGLMLLQKNLGKIFLFSGIVLSFLGIFQLVFIPNLAFLETHGWDPHYFRIVSTFLDPNFAGACFVLTLLLISQEIIFKKLRWNILLFLLLYLSLIFTFSRGTGLMLTVGFLTLSVLKKSFKLFTLTIILALGFGLGFLVYQQTLATAKNINREKSAQYRLTSWEEGLRIFQTSPLLGAGFNSYRYALRQYQLADEAFIQSRGSSGNDSSLLFVAATTGTVGFIAYLGFLISLFYASFKNHLKGSIWGTVLFSGLAGLLVQSFFVNNLFYPWFLAWVILLASKLEYS